MNSISNEVLRWSELIGSTNPSKVEEKLLTFPTIKNRTPQLLAMDLVSVQPMAIPTGIIFHMHGFGEIYKYQTYANLRDGVKYHDRDEFYSYDELLQSYLGEDYPEDYIIANESIPQPSIIH